MYYYNMKHATTHYTLWYNFKYIIETSLSLVGQDHVDINAEYSLNGVARSNVYLYLSKDKPSTGINIQKTIN